MSPEVRKKVHKDRTHKQIADPLLHSVRCLVTTDEFTRVKKTVFAQSLEGYKRDTKETNRKAMLIFLLASQYYKLGSLYFVAQKFRRTSFCSNNLEFICHDISSIDVKKRESVLTSLHKIGVNPDTYNSGSAMPKDRDMVNINGDKDMISLTISNIMTSDVLPISSNSPFPPLYLTTKMKM